MKKMGLLVIAVLVLTFGIGMTVKAGFWKSDEISREQRLLMEEEYMDEVRRILLEKGCKNAGITLTYITDAKGNRDYTITVHHAKLENMDNQELVILQARMQEAAETMLLAKISLKQL